MIAISIALAMSQNVATTPAHRLGEEWWKQRHEHCVEVTKKGGVDVAFLGDSITQGWEGEGKAMWDQHLAPLKSANFGFSGDRTEHVLWRLDNGELLGLKPKLIVIMIGTNNIGHGSSNASATSEGVKAIVGKLRKNIPAAKILLLGIFPRGADLNDPGRRACAEATKGFQALHDGKSVFCEDVGHHFLNRDGTMRQRLMPDLLHPNRSGYEIWTKAMMPIVSNLLK
ncbi:MAG: GDSL-type esterase/lipase family protein [Fimbriimonadaceae bacterium]